MYCTIINGFYTNRKGKNIPNAANLNKNKSTLGISLQNILLNYYKFT